MKSFPGTTPGKRFETGVIVTFSDGTSRHFTGATTKDSLVYAAERADRLGLGVITISTPQTIYRDLQGSREQLVTDRDKVNRSANLNSPESRLLSSISRGDLLITGKESK